jgi:hypothetical protein
VEAPALRLELGRAKRTNLTDMDRHYTAMVDKGGNRRTREFVFLYLSSSSAAVVALERI